MIPKYVYVKRGNTRWNDMCRFEVIIILTGLGNQKFEIVYQKNL